MKKHPWIGSVISILIIQYLSAGITVADTNRISEICERAAAEAANESGVPLSVLRAISLTETGRKTGSALEPWPWTVNMEGIGKWFDTYEKAKSYVDRHFQRGARSFDVGCFQINYRWHHQAFESVEHMFEPRANARYAAKFLSDLYREFGDWSKAAGAYHSRTPKYAKKYTARFNRIRANLRKLPPVELSAADVNPEISPETPRQAYNNYPLLQRGGNSSMASLVPLKAASHARFIEVAPVSSGLGN